MQKGLSQNLNCAILHNQPGNAGLRWRFWIDYVPDISLFDVDLIIQWFTVPSLLSGVVCGQSRAS